MCVSVYQGDTTADENISCEKCAEEMAASQTRVELGFRVCRDQNDE